MAFTAKHCSEREDVESIVTHYATVMKAYVQRRTGQQGKEKGRTVTTKYPSETGIICQPWSEFNQGKKNKKKNESSSMEFADLSAFLFLFSKATQELLSLAAPHGLAERLGMGPRSDSCWAFVIKHARALYRLMTSLITGNYRCSRPLGVPIHSKHPVSNVSNDTGTITVVALLNHCGGCGHCRVLTKK